MSVFRTTLWSRLGEAAAGKPSALEEFATSYRAPVAAFLRARGLSDSDAEDVTQEVFLRMLSRDLLAKGDENKGRFRSYLMGITLHVLSERRRHIGAVKRGGEVQHLPLDLAPPPAALAEFDGFWLREILQRALARVEAASSAEHEVLCLAGEELSPTEIAERTGRSVGSIRAGLHRARKRLAKELKQEIAAYCSTEAEYQRELESFARYLG